MEAMLGSSGRVGLEGEAGDRLERVIDRDGPSNLTSCCLTAIGDEHYASGFFKALGDPVTGHPLYAG
jgi:hypothetical protein